MVIPNCNKTKIEVIQYSHYGHASAEQFTGCHTFGSILVADLQRRARSLHGDHGEVLLHSLDKYLGANSYVSRMNTLHFLHPAKVRKGAKIRNCYNQVPHLTQDTNGKATNSQLDTTNESQEVSPFPAGDHNAHINNAHKGIANTRQKKHSRSTKEVPPWNGQ